MKKVYLLLLILQTVTVYPQDKSDSLLNLLESAAGQERIGILTDLCWENRFTAS